MTGKTRETFVPDPEQMALWPDISGNTVNGLGETARRRASRVYWHDPAATPHGALQLWFYGRNTHPALAEARAERQIILDAPLPDVAADRVEAPPQTRAGDVVRVAIESSADQAAIVRFNPDWIFEGASLPEGLDWMVVIAIGMDYDAMSTAPEATAGAEVIRQYARGTKAAKGLAGWIRQQGYRAEPHSGPMAGPILLIPAAIEAGLGELGKHGSLINRTLGSNFRLACVLTDMPLVADGPDSFGVDDFCTNCQVCSNACPPDAIFAEKQTVRGETKWYVNFDKCLPFFNETAGCGICIAVCPWSRPGVGPRLAEKMARKRANRDQGGH